MSCTVNISRIQCGILHAFVQCSVHLLTLLTSDYLLGLKMHGHLLHHLRQEKRSKKRIIKRVLLQSVIHCICWIGTKLKALREHKPPWPDQIIAPVLPTVYCVWKDVKLPGGNSVTMHALHWLGGERLTPKLLESYLPHDQVMLQLLWCLVLIYSS